MSQSKIFILILIIYSSNAMTQEISLDILQGKTTKHLVGDSIMLEAETFKAFEKMKKAALKDGIKIKVISSMTRLLVI